MSTHTPGPWRAVPQPGQTEGVHTYTHCVMYGDDSVADTLTKANARLIAAAPDMLAALRAASLALMGCAGINDENEAERAEAIATARAAIAKATGDTTKGGANGEG